MYKRCAFLILLLLIIPISQANFITDFITGNAVNNNFLSVSPKTINNGDTLTININPSTFFYKIIYIQQGAF